MLIYLGLGVGGGKVVHALAFNSVNPSSNTNQVHNSPLGQNSLRKMKIKNGNSREWPTFKNGNLANATSFGSRNMTHLNILNDVSSNILLICRGR